MERRLPPLMAPLELLLALELELLLELELQLDSAKCIMLSGPPAPPRTEKLCDVGGGGKGAVVGVGEVSSALSTALGLQAAAVAAAALATAFFPSFSLSKTPPATAFAFESSLAALLASASSLNSSSTICQLARMTTGRGEGQVSSGDAGQSPAV